MDTAFFRSRPNQPSRPRYSPAVRGIPVQQDQRRPTATSSPKVVSIPVHFVGSETTRSASALKIQKVFRGFLVRKSVRKVASIRNEVNEIERRISKGETVELIRRDPKERLRINETLMALLFKLDSVRGIDSGVRDCRKSVIKKAIALQEKVDAIVAAPDQTLAPVNNSETSDQAVEVHDSDTLVEAVDHTLEIKDSIECPIDSVNSTEQVLESQGADCKNSSNQTLEPEGRTLEVEVPGNPLLMDTNCSENAVDDSAPDYGETEAGGEGIQSLAEHCDEMDITEVEVDSEVKADEEPCVVKGTVENGNRTPSASECAEEIVQTSPTENWLEYSANPQSLIKGGEENTPKKLGDSMEVNMKECLGAGERDDNKRNRELLERMMGDNEKMMSLMTQLCVRNEMQTRMLSSLSHRVEQLEKALRRKKKRHSA